MAGCWSVRWPQTDPRSPAAVMEKGNSDGAPLALAGRSPGNRAGTCFSGAGTSLAWVYKWL